MSQAVRRMFLSLVVIITVAGQARADLVFFTNRAAFEAALGSILRETFSVPDDRTLNPGSPVTGDRVTISVTGPMLGFGDGIVNNELIMGIGNSSSNHWDTAVIDLGVSVGAFGATWRDPGDANPIDITAGPDTFNINEEIPSPAGTTFLGFISDTVFSSITISGGPTPNLGEVFWMDDLVFDTSAPIFTDGFESGDVTAWSSSIP